MTGARAFKFLSRTSYRQHLANSKALLKTITKVKIFTATIKKPKAEQGMRRKEWSKFGDACKDELERLLPDVIKADQSLAKVTKFTCVRAPTSTYETRRWMLD